MIIANPIYDVVFKSLMQNDRIAKFFIGTLLNETIEEIQLQSQEVAYRVDNADYESLFRLDFVATIKTADNEYKKVLIEVQKARKVTDIMRFRNYLGEHYKKKDTILTPEGSNTTPLPIIAIYILGFNLPEIISPAIKVNHTYLDLITHKTLQEKCDFVENLTHDSYVVQVGRISKEKAKTKLEELLRLFEQDNFIDESHILKAIPRDEIDDEEIKLMAEILEKTGESAAERKMMENEREAKRVYDVHYGEQREELIKKEKELREKNKAIEEKNKAIEQRNKAIEEKEKALEEKDRLIATLMQQLKNE